jgi:hypothetical protein
MKKAILFLMPLLLTAASFCQQTNPAPSQTKQDYLQKSKNQKTAAWVLLGGGAALLIGGVAWGSSDWEATGPSVLFVAGGLSMLGSIPLFISSGKNKKRAISMSFKNEKVPWPLTNNVTNHSLPSITLKLSL